MAAELNSNLKRFLAENGAYDAFMSNREKDSFPTPIETINIFKGEDCISAAFLWGRTLEGFQYWKTLAEEFDKIDTK